MNEPHYVLYTCGSRGSRPVNGAEFLEFGGQTTCYVLRRDERALVLDCGTGLYSAAPILLGCTQIDVFLTHLHYDHILGLLDWSVFPSNAEVTFYSTFDNWFGKETLDEFFRAPFWPVQPKLGRLVQLPSPGMRFWLWERLCVQFYPSSHPNEANMIFLQAGDKKVCMLFDYEHCKRVPAELMERCDLMIYDGMYTDAEYPQHVGWGHSTWQEGCRLAQSAHAQKLLITHHAPLRTDTELRQMEDQAKKIFPSVRFARAGDQFTL